MGALPLVALLVLDASAFQVSLLAAMSGVASAVIALPLGVRIEHQYKRPVMIAADLSSEFSRRRRPSRSAKHI